MRDGKLGSGRCIHWLTVRAATPGPLAASGPAGRGRAHPFKLRDELGWPGALAIDTRRRRDPAPAAACQRPTRNTLESGAMSVTAEDGSVPFYDENTNA